MKASLVHVLVDPVNRESVRLKAALSAHDEVVSGFLETDEGRSYSIHDGIPRFVMTEDSGQRQTANAFGYKWGKRDSYDTPQFKELVTPWTLNKFGFHDVDEWTSFYQSHDRILDLGCGSGFSSSLWLDRPAWTGRSAWVGVDISTSIDVAKQRLGHLANTHFVQADALQLPFQDACFDAIYSDGVLHHTPSTRQGLHSAARVLARGGHFHFYVYRRKGAVREFTDDYIREQISTLSDEDAWNAMRSLTSLAQSLVSLRTNVIVKEDVPLLGIKAGEQDVQRLIYWNFAKLYWNETLSFEENVHVNFDWYRPKYASRHSAEEIHHWSSEAGLDIEAFHEQESGFSVRAIKC